MKNFLLSMTRMVKHQNSHYVYKTIWQRLHIDPVLLLGIMILLSISLGLLYSSSNQDFTIILKQVIRMSIAISVMLLIAQIPAYKIKVWTPLIYSVSLFLLLSVLIIGTFAKGSQRWLAIGLFNFQPSEMMKLTVPMMVAWYFSHKRLPPQIKSLFFAGLIILIPAFLITKQPDLGTALMVFLSGIAVVFFAGVSLGFFMSLLGLFTITAPFLILLLHDYQRQRILSFLNPESDPLGHGYHIIQSKIAIGSGGILGKGWLNGSQGKLNFIPEDSTDFIFVILAEEFGLIGCAILLMVVLFIVARCLYIASHAQDHYTRLLAGSIGLIIFFSCFINIGMVTGLLPVVGLPLPLVRYGGSSMLILMAGFGILMSIHTHRKFLSD